MLAGHRPSTEAELDYIRVRARTLVELADVLAETIERDGTRDPIVRQARIEARREIEHNDGSSLTDAAALVEELRRGPA